ncbi:hypothetical protein ACK3SF_01370 [Candidatus Nanosalina sp. VS9-1]|uniref:hypothetical protein n=1 Tax=Candidatus Nanosalina sp. VS9-1 TaxID=3388566 RepID=UPI0039E0F648
MEEIKDLGKLDEGDKILFDERSQPLEIQETDEKKVIVEGPKGGQYQIFDEDAKHFLISKPGDREYASYIKNLRRIGEWIETDEDSYRHTDTEASLELVKNSAGFWTVKASGIQNLDLPKYGFSDKEAAREQLEKILDSNPEG